MTLRHRLSHGHAQRVRQGDRVGESSLAGRHDIPSLVDTVGDARCAFAEEKLSPHEWRVEICVETWVSLLRVIQ